MINKKRRRALASLVLIPGCLPPSRTVQFQSLPLSSQTAPWLPDPRRPAAPFRRLLGPLHPHGLRHHQADFRPQGPALSGPRIQVAVVVPVAAAAVVDDVAAVADGILLGYQSTDPHSLPAASHADLNNKDIMMLDLEVVLCQGWH